MASPPPPPCPLESKGKKPKLVWDDVTGFTAENLDNDEIRYLFNYRCRKTMLDEIVKSAGKGSTALPTWIQKVHTGTPIAQNEVSFCMMNPDMYIDKRANRVGEMKKKFKVGEPLGEFATLGEPLRLIITKGDGKRMLYLQEARNKPQKGQRPKKPYVVLTERSEYESVIDKGEKEKEEKKQMS